MSEFYFQSGAMLGLEPAQRAYLSVNHTHAAREPVNAPRNSRSACTRALWSGGGLP